MMKRMLPLLALAIVVSFAAAPDAEACQRCSWGQQKCVDVSWGGMWWCNFDIPTQTCTGEDPCPTGPGFADAPMPFALDYQVVSVERLDEPPAPQNETRTASLDIRKD